MSLYIACIKAGEVVNSKPCLHCLEYIRKFNINKIYYTTESGWKLERVKDMSTAHISKGYKK